MKQGTQTETLNRVQTARAGRSVLNPHYPTNTKKPKWNLAPRP